MSETIIGIDLGTTNSEVAFIQEGQPQVVLEDDDPILPSFVGLSEDGRLLVGKPARNQWLLAPERTIKSIKRKMGQDVTVRLGDQEYRPPEISAMILRELRERAGRALGAPVTKAVITVPAYFNDGQRQATREAGELAGLEVVRILNEPTAAALAYDPNQERLKRLLVYDLGGGTFDVSIVQAQEGVVEVLASHGDTQLGGDDFDDKLFQFVREQFQEEHGFDLHENVGTRARVMRAAEEAKKHLSFHPHARIEEEFIGEKDGAPLHLSMEIARDDYEDLIRPLLDRTVDCLKRALEDADLSPSNIDKVVLVGGSTRTPLVSEMLRERMNQEPHQEVNRDLCFALGAGIQAGIIAGLDVGAVLVDVTPHTLGIKCLDDSTFALPFEHRFARIIHRNTSLPRSESEVFYTYHDNQTQVEIDVYQGELDDVRRNARVGRFLIQGLAHVPAGNQIVVQFDLNLDGILKVTARERATGLQKQVSYENALSDRARHEESQSRLDRLWLESGGSGQVPASFVDEEAQESEEDVVPTLAPGPREGQREAVQARALLEKADRLMERVSEDDRGEVEQLMERVRAALTERNWEELKTASGELSDVLFYLEDA